MSALARATLLPDFQADRQMEGFQIYLHSRNLSPRTQKEYPRKVERIWSKLEMVGVSTPQTVTLHSLELVQSAFLFEEWKGRSISPNTVRSYLSAFRTYFRWLFKHEKIQSNPADLLELPKRVKRLNYRVPEEHEVDQLLSACDDSALGIRDKAIISLAYDAGLRNQEIRNICIQDLNLKELRVFVRNGKGGKDARLPITPYTAVLIADYLDVIRPDLLNGRYYNGSPVYCGVDAAKEGMLFLSINGHQMTGSNLLHSFQKRASSLGWDWVPKLHSLRGAMATHLHKAGANFLDIKRLCRHESTKTTEGYIKSDFATLKAAHERFHPLMRRKVA